MNVCVCIWLLVSSPYLVCETVYVTCCEKIDVKLLIDNNIVKEVYVIMFSRQKILILINIVINQFRINFQNIIFFTILGIWLSATAHPLVLLNLLLVKKKTKQKSILAKVAKKKIVGNNWCIMKLADVKNFGLKSIRGRLS